MDIFSFLQSMGPLQWLTFAVVLLVLELLTGGTTFLLWPAAAAFAVTLLDLVLPMNWQAQWSVFAVLTLALLWVGQVYIRPRMKGGDKEHLNERGDRMVGQTAEVRAKFVNGQGRVRVDDTTWEARSKDESNLAAGAKVVIEAVDGVTLIVRPE